MRRVIGREARGMSGGVLLIPGRGRGSKAGAGNRGGREEEQAQRNANGRDGLDMQRKKYLRRARTVEHRVKAETEPPLHPEGKPGETAWGSKRQGRQGEAKRVRLVAWIGRVSSAASRTLSENSIFERSAFIGDRLAR